MNTHKVITIKFKDKKLMKNPAVRMWVKDFEEYVNIKFDREIKGLISHELRQQIHVMVYGHQLDED